MVPSANLRRSLLTTSGHYFLTCAKSFGPCFEGGLDYLAMTASLGLTRNSARIPSSNLAPSTSNPFRVCPPFSLSIVLNLTALNTNCTVSAALMSPSVARPTTYPSRSFAHSNRGGGSGTSPNHLRTSRCSTFGNNERGHCSVLSV